MAPDLPVSSFALFDSGDYSLSGNGAHGVSESFSPAVYFDSDFADLPTREMLDRATGPGGLLHGRGGGGLFRRQRSPCVAVSPRKKSKCFGIDAKTPGENRGFFV